jgi:hypothetical protein
MLLYYQDIVYYPHSEQGDLPCFAEEEEEYVLSRSDPGGYVAYLAVEINDAQFTRSLVSISSTLS